MKPWTLLALAAALAACGPREDPNAPLPGYAEAELTRVAAPIGGRLLRLDVQRGAQVASGAPLFTLEQDSEAAALREAQAREQRSEALARDLAKGQRRDELAAAQAALDAARAAFRQSQSDFNRERDLAARGFISGAGLDAVRARRDADEARVRQLEAQLRTAHQGGREDTRAAAQAEAAAASQVVAQQRWRVEQKSVTAPVAARVEDTLFRPGEWVAAGAPVVSLMEPGAIKLRFFVPEGRLARVQPGVQVSVSCDGCGAPITATVRHVSQQAEFTPPVIYSKDNRTKLVFLIEAWPAAADALKLHPGQPVEVRLPA